MSLKGSPNAISQEQVIIFGLYSVRLTGPPSIRWTQTHIYVTVSGTKAKAFDLFSACICAAVLNSLISWYCCEEVQSIGQGHSSLQALCEGPIHHNMCPTVLQQNTLKNQAMVGWRGQHMSIRASCTHWAGVILSSWFVKKSVCSLGQGCFNRHKQLLPLTLQFWHCSFILPTDRILCMCLSFQQFLKIQHCKEDFFEGSAHVYTRDWCRQHPVNGDFIWRSQTIGH